MQHKKDEYIRSIERYVNEYKSLGSGASPTVREISSRLGLSPGTVSKYLSYMRSEGILDYSGHRNITTASDSSGAGDFCRVPVLGAVSCGLPKFAEENIEEYVQLPVSLFGKGSFFILKANGDSMINAGIFDGDMVLIRQQSIADYNQIVVALVDDEATLKRFRPEKDGIHLHAENPDYPDLVTERCVIQGVAVKVIRNIS